MSEMSRPTEQDYINAANAYVDERKRGYGGRPVAYSIDNAAIRAVVDSAFAAGWRAARNDEEPAPPTPVKG